VTDPNSAAGETSQHPEPAPVTGPGETIDVKRGMFGVAGSGDTSGYGGLVRRVQTPPSTLRPFGGYFDSLADELERLLPSYGEAIERVVVDRGEITFYVRREHLLDVMRAMRDEPGLRFEMCMGVNGAHYPDDTGRELHAVYPLLSVTHNRRVRVEVACPDADPHIPSVTSLYPSNDWHERETFDFFGIVFDGHPGLTRIQMPDDWPGHPQRKDYPLGGIPVEYKGAQIPPPDERRAYS
jgi:NADH-quinone oxidoreductase subunit C